MSNSPPALWQQKKESEAGERERRKLSSQVFKYLLEGRMPSSGGQLTWTHSESSPLTFLILALKVPCPRKPINSRQTSTIGHPNPPPHTCVCTHTHHHQIMCMWHWIWTQFGPSPALGLSKCLYSFGWELFCLFHGIVHPGWCDNSAPNQPLLGTQASVHRPIFIPLLSN